MFLTPPRNVATVFAFLTAAGKTFHSVGYREGMATTTFKVVLMKVLGSSGNILFIDSALGRVIVFSFVVLLKILILALTKISTISQFPTIPR